MIYEYFSKVKDKLEIISWIILRQAIDFEVVSKDLGIIEGILVFLDNSSLEFMELVGEKEMHYRFNYMDKDKNIIFRWDTAPHHKEISSHPFHLHTKKGVEESRKVNLTDVLDIVAENVIGNLGFD